MRAFLFSLFFLTLVFPTECFDIDTSSNIVIDQINFASRNLSLPALEGWLEKEADTVAVCEPPFCLRQSSFKSYKHRWIRTPGNTSTQCGFFCTKISVTKSCSCQTTLRESRPLWPHPHRDIWRLSPEESPGALQYVEGSSGGRPFGIRKAF